MLERLSDLDQDRNDLEIAHAAQTAQVPARRELRRQCEHVAVPNGRIELQNMGMSEPARDLVGADERLPAAGTGGDFRPQHLERDLFALVMVACAPHLALAALAELAEEGVSVADANSGSGESGHIRSSRCSETAPRLMLSRRRACARAPLPAVRPEA